MARGIMAGADGAKDEGRVDFGQFGFRGRITIGSAHPSPDAKTDVRRGRRVLGVIGYPTRMIV